MAATTPPPPAARSPELAEGRAQLWRRSARAKARDGWRQPDGLQSPLTTTTQTTPGGLIRSDSLSRTATLTDPNNPLTLTNQTTLRVINGKTWRTDYFSSPRRIVDTSPVGRTTTQFLDLQGKITRIDRPGITSILFGYDANGRLQTITQGARVTTNTYHSAGPAHGYLETIRNALSQTTAFEPDALGRSDEHRRTGPVSCSLLLGPCRRVGWVTPPQP